jgi:hypothetical protein
MPRAAWTLPRAAALLALALAAWAAQTLQDRAARSGPAATTDSQILEAYRSRRSELMVEGGGRVSRILDDDRQGSRHQRFLVTLDGGHTLLVAHNIDVAARVPLEAGDTIDFRGQYEWNEKGGVLHWTHRDPEERHPGGWIRHEGRVFE